MSAEKLKQAGQDEFAKITQQIKDLELMIIENSRDIKQFQEANVHLRETIELLKERRRIIVGIAQRVSPLTATDEAWVKKIE